MTARGQGRVDLDATRAQLEQVGLVHAAERLAELVEESVKGNEPAHRFLDRLLAAEAGEGRPTERLCPATCLRTGGRLPAASARTAILGRGVPAVSVGAERRRPVADSSGGDGGARPRAANDAHRAVDA
jgi:hypothetical protein